MLRSIRMFIYAEVHNFHILSLGIHKLIYTAMYILIKCLASDYLRVTVEDWLYQEQTVCHSIYILSVAVKADPWSCIAYCRIVFGGPPIYQPNIVKLYVYTSIMHCSIILHRQQHIVTEKDISICIKVILFFCSFLIYIYVCVYVCLFVPRGM